MLDLCSIWGRSVTMAFRRNHLALPIEVPHGKLIDRGGGAVERLRRWVEMSAIYSSRGTRTTPYLGRVKVQLQSREANW